MAKFLVIHPNLDIYGGGERVCHHILKSLVANCQQVELLTFDFNLSLYEKFMGEALPREITIHNLGNRKEVEAKPPLSVYKRRRNIIRLLKKFKQNAAYDYTISTQTISAFETELFDGAKKNIAYVHFPEIHYDYEHSKKGRKIYLWLYKRLIEKDIGKLDLLFCNSKYTKNMTERYWCKFGIKEPIIVYPSIEERFWSSKPIDNRPKRVLYVGRFVSQKRHDLMKRLAVELPDFEFVSAGLLRDSERLWFDELIKDSPSNYIVKPNLPEEALIQLFHSSQIYCHLMEGEHFGITPMEALASGCITIVHNSGGSGEFISPDFLWDTFQDLKSKISKILVSNNFAFSKKQQKELRDRLAVLHPQKFEDKIWSHIEVLMQKN